MATAKLTTKGQMVLPAAVRTKLGLRPGDRLDVRVEDGRIVLTPLTLELDDIVNLLPPSGVKRSLDEIEAAIAIGAVRGAALDRT